MEDCPSSDAQDYPVVESNYECLSWVYDTYTTTTAVESYISSNCTVNNQYVFGKSGCFCNVHSTTKSIFNRCIFTGSQDIDESDSDANASDYMKMWMADIYTARAVIFGFGFVIALVFAFLFTYLMSFELVAGAIVWGCIFGVLALAVGMTGMAYSTLKEWKAEDPEQHTASQRAALEGFVWTLQILCFIWFLIMCWMYKAVQVAIKCVVMGSKAIDEMPALVFFPIVQIFAFCLFMVPWMFYALYIASDGTFEAEYQTIPGSDATVQVGRTWNANDESNVSGKLWYMLFALLWTMNFISNFGALVISHSVATWYFTKPDDRVEAISNMTIWESFKLCLRFHSGTVALGSFLIAAVQFMRAVALYIQRNTSRDCRKILWVKIVFCCINCCLCMLECCMKFIAKHAYIQTAIHGTAFCPSAKNMFSLIARNMLRIGALTLTSELVLFIGKLFVTLLATGCSYFFMSGDYSDQLYDIVGPTIFVAILSWTTATMFMDVVHMGVDTILHCFISDEEHNDGVAVFASDDMKGFVEDNGHMKGIDDDEDKSAEDKSAEPTGKL